MSAEISRARFGSHVSGSSNEISSEHLTHFAKLPPPTTGTTLIHKISDCVCKGAVNKIRLANLLREQIQRRVDEQLGLHK